MKRENLDHGFSDEVWRAAKEEARQAMIDVASRRDVMSYSDLVQRITNCDLEPHSSHLAHMLGEISTEENEEGRGLLTVLVVHKTGDGKPGSGFFKLAESRGRDTSDTVQCWIEELKKVHDVWS
ncbi:hypothetical protein [Candidatus Palauibacter sp.]|uniref:hypothetical protein n=1 Tax=Candidatus Palauibacter sp. TaxID=3101350 RepID=UPI003AF2A3F2